MKENNKAEQEIITKVSKWGNSLGIRLPKKIVDQLKIEEGSEIRINQKENKVEMSKSESKWKVPSLEQVLNNFPDDYDPRDYDLGEPMGREIW
ncbi:AbrB/MazE/SpoVT family DNA-binding domain-containing protein [Candidatus Pacebacteria bacterium]|nr:AbrB/MazE/SpoVT family DNA-binding domain-containing protein [Candidatus Paceibacterota bacterium]